MKNNPLTNVPASPGKVLPGKRDTMPERIIMDKALTEAKRKGIDPEGLPVMSRSRSKKQAQKVKDWENIIHKAIAQQDPPWDSYKRDAMYHALLNASLEGVKPGERRWVRFIQEGWTKVHNKIRGN